MNMGTESRNNTFTWFQLGKSRGHSRMIIVWDKWDNFPLYVPQNKDAKEVWAEYSKGKNQLSVDEVFDLTKDWQKQIEEGVKNRW